jgi:hypothetical protein
MATKKTRKPAATQEGDTYAPGLDADAPAAAKDVAKGEKADHTAIFERAKKRIDEYKEVWSEQHDRIREDLRFSNPAKPEQWRQDDLAGRGKRPTLTLDRTNQFIAQVSNDMRQNNAGIEVIPADGDADSKVAEQLESMVRHIEYVSRAPIAYDTAGDLQVRCGLGWLRAVPVDGKDGQDICILRITDPTSCGIDLDCHEPDGAGARWGYVEGKLHRSTFEERYPDAAEVPLGTEGWRDGEYVTICEYFEIDDEGNQVWMHMTGAEVIEPPIPFPSQYLALVPVVGYELEVDGKRFLCGLTRRLMDGQRLHNFEMSAIAEFLASQPKAPLIAPAESMAGYEAHYKRLASGNPAVLPYRAWDEKGRALPAPQRVMPAPMPGAYAQMAQFATEEMQASVGMYKANLGQAGNETSGVAIRNRQMEGDVATLQFPDNHGKSQAQLGRVIVDMIPRMALSRRVQRLVAADGKHSFITVDPAMKKPTRRGQDGKLAAINPKIGTYDVCVKSGPSYTTAREETFSQLSDIIAKSPALAPVLMPMWAKLKDMPQSDMLVKLLLAVAPPAVQQIYGEGEEIPPHVAAEMQHLKQQLEQMQGAMHQAADKLEELQADHQAKQIDALSKTASIRVDQYKAETDRLKVMGAGMTREQVQAIVMDLMGQVFAQGAPDGSQPGQPGPDAAMQPPMGGDPTVGPAGPPADDGSGLPTGFQQNAPPAPPPVADVSGLPDNPLAHQAPDTSNEPPKGGFSLPEGAAT